MQNLIEEPYCTNQPDFSADARGRSVGS